MENKISTKQIKYIQSLQQKKFRAVHDAFVAEGDKIVTELLGSELQIESIFALPEWFEDIEPGLLPQDAFYEVSMKELERISGQKTPNRVVAVVRKPPHTLPEAFAAQELVLMPDKIQDPGNLGTIIRTADWFGVKHIICSPDTADVYNPKVIQSSMGSFMRVKVHYTGLVGFLEKMKGQLPVYGAFLDGDNVFEAELHLPAILIVGNESQGISRELECCVSQRLMIPAGRVETAPGRAEAAIGRADAATERAGHAAGRAESLNAAVAAGILMGCFRNYRPPGQS